MSARIISKGGDELESAIITAKLSKHHLLTRNIHLTRCLRVRRDAAASQLNKHLSTNSDTCVRAHIPTADNCGVVDHPGAQSGA